MLLYTCNIWHVCLSWKRGASSESHPDISSIFFPCFFPPIREVVFLAGNFFRYLIRRPRDSGCHNAAQVVKPVILGCINEIWHQFNGQDIPKARFSGFILLKLLPPPSTICSHPSLFAGLFVSRIMQKARNRFAPNFGGGMRHGPGENPLHFGADLNHFLWV